MVPEFEQVEKLVVIFLTLGRLILRWLLLGWLLLDGFFLEQSLGKSKILLTFTDFDFYWQVKANFEQVKKILVILLTLNKSDFRQNK